MSIETEIIRLQSAKSALKSKFTDKGVDVADDALIDTFPDKADDMYNIAYTPLKGMLEGGENIVIPNGVTKIDDYAFYNNTKVKSVIIPDSVTSIGDSAFYGCSSLTSINIPDGVTSIGDSAFDGCTNLPIIDNLRYADTYLISAIDKTLTGYKIKDDTRFINRKAFQNCSSLTSINIPDGVTSIGAYTFQNCSSLTSINIPDGVTSIGAYAFDSCSGLTSINIPDGVTSIGAYAFDSCSGLTSINIPDGVTSIDTLAFQNCSSLTSVTIPSSVTSIGAYAFVEMTLLTNFTIKASTPPQCGGKIIGLYSTKTWDYDTIIATIYVPSASVDAYKSATNWSRYASYIKAIPES